VNLGKNIIESDHKPEKRLVGSVFTAAKWYVLPITLMLAPPVGRCWLQSSQWPNFALLPRLLQVITVQYVISNYDHREMLLA
jgi:hypothetical protein